MDKTAIEIPFKDVEIFCRKHGIQRLSFFGSVVRKDFSPNSDVDVLVEFKPGHIPGYDFFLIEAELSRLLGRKVDLQTKNFLSPDIRRNALNEAVTIYEPV
jgi:predicted nucleotidyltransferase